MNDDEDFAFRYMARFQCIGPACEQHCCGGWRVDVDAKHHELLRMAAGRMGSDRERIRGAFFPRPPDPGEKKKVKGQQPQLLKLDKHGNCVLLEPDRRCHIHATLGANLLPDVCAIYPRKIVKLGERLELSGAVSCPEVARQLLLHDDAVDQVPLERETMIPRRILHSRVETRDVRAFWRLMPTLRAFALRRLSDTTRPFAQRLFVLTLFSHRTQAILSREGPSGDYETVHDEVRRLDDPAVLDEIGRRFDAIQTPALPALLIARELVRRDVAGHRQPQFLHLVGAVFDTYANLDLTEFRRYTLVADQAMSAAIQAAYEQRKAQAMAAAGPRIDRYLRNFVFHSWVHHLQNSAPDLMVFTLRMLLHLAAIRFLFFSHPRLYAWFADPPVDPPAGAFETICDEAIVEVVRKLGRYIEHSALVTSLEAMLGDRQMRSLGGAVHLINF